MDYNAVITYFFLFNLIRISKVTGSLSVVVIDSTLAFNKKARKIN